MEDYKKLDSPLDYYGGKNWFLKYWPKYIPPHKVYAELCGGSGILLLAKPPCPIEIFNDKNESVYNFFKVLRDPIKSRQLKGLLELTPYGRQEYEDCKKIQIESPDDVERARAWFVRVDRHERLYPTPAGLVKLSRVLENCPPMSADISPVSIESFPRSVKGLNLSRLKTKAFSNCCQRLTVARHSFP